MLNFIRIILLCFVCLSANAKSFIYHGDRVINDQQFPFVVAIYDKKNSEALCTGSLIADRWVLTAGHCLWGVSPYDRQVGIGYRAGNKMTAKRIISVKEVFTYYDPDDAEKWPYGRVNHDVALLKLSEAVDITPISLPTDSNKFLNLKSGSQSATAVGYGWTDISWSSICEKNQYDRGCYPQTIQDEYLHVGEQLIQPNITIDELLKKYKALDNILESEPSPSYNPATMIGVISLTGQHGTSGDSGGPLLIKQNQDNEKVKYIQVGVASWGLPPSYNAYKEGYFTKEPVIYASLLNQDILYFIETTMNNNP